MQKVFVSYRRDDTQGQARNLKLILEELLPEVVVFLDSASITPGEVWSDRLHHELDSADLILALIGSHWRFDRDNSDRLASADDWVRREMAIALERDPGLLLPVMVDAANEKSARRVTFSDLPQDIARLSQIETFALRNSDFDADIERLARQIARTLQTDFHATELKFPHPNDIKREAELYTPEDFDRLKARLDSLDGWRYVQSVPGRKGEPVTHSELRKTFEFTNFKRAFSFMNASALLAEGKQHHPTWSNTWATVEVRLWTFDRGGVTWYDIDMAGQMTKIARHVAAARRPDWPENWRGG